MSVDLMGDKEMENQGQNGVLITQCGIRNISPSMAVAITLLLPVIACASMLLILFTFFPFDETTPPTLMSVLAHDFVQMNKSTAVAANKRIRHVIAYTEPPILSDGRKQHLTIAIDNGAIILSMPNGGMAVNFLRMCVRKYNCQVSNATDNTRIRITVTQRSAHV